MTNIYLLPLEEAALLPESFCEKNFPNRLQRARRFRRTEDQLRCIGAGALLQGVLHVREPEIQYGQYGKPFVPDSDHFSLSHSGNYTLLAVDDSTIGADIEEIDSGHLKIAKRVFNPEEQDWMAADPIDRFFILWTLKESVMKFFGAGLSMPPLSFSVIDLVKGGQAVVRDRTLYSGSLMIEGHVISVCTGKPMADLNPILCRAKDLI